MRLRERWFGVRLVRVGLFVINEGVRKVFASSALLTEALAVFYALAWAKGKNWEAIHVCSDSLQLLAGLRRVEDANVLVQRVLVDI